MDIRTVNGAWRLFPVASGGTAPAPGRAPSTGQIHHPGARTVALAAGVKAIRAVSPRGQRPTQGRLTRRD